MKKNVLITIVSFICVLIYSNRLNAQAPASPFGINSNCTNILLNGDFDNGSANWNAGNGWVFSNNAINTVDATNSVLSQNIPFLVGDENGFVQLSFGIQVATGSGGPSNPVTFSVELNNTVYATVVSRVGATDQRTTVTYFNGASGDKVGNTNPDGCDIGSICCTSLTNHYAFTNTWKIWIPVTPGPALLGFRFLTNTAGGSSDDILLRNIRLMSCADFGDAPESYGTVVPNAAIHGIRNTLMLGKAVDANVDGLPARPDSLPVGDDHEASLSYSWISGTASQSSDSINYAAAINAIDHIAGSPFNYGNGPTVGMPAITLAGPYEWWMVDLGRPLQVGDITIWNRWDCCQANLSNASIMLFSNTFTPVNTSSGFANAQSTAVYSTQLGDMSNTSDITINAGNQTARYVLIQRTGNTNASLGLDEVRVMAKPSDDEDGVANFSPLNTVNGQVYTNYKVDVAVTNTTGSTANLCGWIDWNNNSTFEQSEGVCTTVPANATRASLLWPSATLTTSAAVRGAYARFRITTDGLNTGNFTGIASDGEVEDYLIPEIDFTALPLQLLNFSANKKGDDVVLSWQVANEKNDKGFYVQYGIDGHNWQTIAFIPGAGYTNMIKSYSYVHHADKSEMKRYYRLLDEDGSGSITVSDVRQVDFATTGDIRLSPNPVKDILYIRSNGLFTPTQLSLYSSTGELLMQNMYRGNNTLLNLSRFAAGVYILKLSDDKGQFTCHKIMKQ
jgi:hypothetical protein